MTRRSTVSPERKDLFEIKRKPLFSSLKLKVNYRGQLEHYQDSKLIKENHESIAFGVKEVYARFMVTLLSSVASGIVNDLN